MSDQPEPLSTPEGMRIENLIKLKELETVVDKYTKGAPKRRLRKDQQLEEIEKGMNEIKGKLQSEQNRKIYNALIGKLDKYENSDLFIERYKDRVVKPKHKLEKIDEKVKEEVKKIEERIGDAGGDIEEVDERKEGEEEEGGVIFEDIGSQTTEEEEDDEAEITTEEEEEEAKEEVKGEEEEVKREEEVKGEEEEGKEEETIDIEDRFSFTEDAEGISPEMEEFHNQIRKDERERVIKEFGIKIDNEDKIDIPKERLGTEGKSVEILNDDIKYFLKRFPDLLKLERNVYNKSDKKDRKLLVDIHRRIQAKLSSPEDEEKSKRIGIILDADAYIDSKINELLARKTLEGLTPANLVDITKEPKSIGKDVGSYTLTKMGGRDVVQNAPVYRAIPSTSTAKAVASSGDEAEMEEPKEAKINQSTIYKNSGKTKVDIAKMELNTNPFIKRTRPQRLNIIL
jgi:hypothetical protein